MIYFSVSKHIGFIIQRGVITAKIRFGILLCFLPMQCLMFSLASVMLRIVFNVFLMMFAKTSLLFCCLCIRLSQFQICLCLLAYGVMRNFDAIIRVSKYVRLNPGLQRARPLWCGASKDEICIFFPRKEIYAILNGRGQNNLTRPTWILMARNQFFIVLETLYNTVVSVRLGNIITLWLSDPHPIKGF